MDNYRVVQGTALTVLVTLNDGEGNLITTYDGSEPLVATIWPGASLAASCSPATAWISPTSLGQITFTISAAQSAALGPGRYRLLIVLTDSGVNVDAYECTIDVADAPGSDTAPPAYTTYKQLRSYAKGWLTLLQARDDGTGFTDEQGRARAWIEQVGQSHYRVTGMVMVVGNQAFGPRRSGADSDYLADSFAANTLMLRPRIIEMLCYKALGYITENVVDGDNTKTYAKLAMFHHNRANYLAACTTLQLDTDGDGEPDIVIDLSTTDTMFA